MILCGKVYFPQLCSNRVHKPELICVMTGLIKTLIRECKNRGFGLLLEKNN